MYHYKLVAALWDQNSPETRRQWNQWIRDGTRRRWSRPGERSPERDFKKAHSQVPRYSGTTPWRLWKMEFALWLRSCHTAAIPQRGTNTPHSRGIWHRLSKYLPLQQNQTCPRSSLANEYKENTRLWPLTWLKNFLCMKVPMEPTSNQNLNW